MPEVSINMWAVLVSALAAFAVGGIWYGPLFGKIWANLIGMKLPSKEELHKMKGKMIQAYALQFINSFLMAYVLAHILDFTNTTTIGQGMQGAFWCWLGFIATTFMGKVLWENKPWKLYFLDTAHYLINLLIMGSILAVWQ